MLRISLSEGICREGFRQLRGTKPSLASKFAILLPFAASFLLLTGCGIGTLNTTPSPVAATQDGMHGRVHGGNQPVTGALIQLWAADPTDYPNGATPQPPVQLLTATVKTDGTGSFNITGDYVNGCNDNNDPLVYITATGGNPGLADGTDNPALVLMTPLGDCDNLQANAGSIFVDINEVSTVASAFALAQFAGPNPHGSGIVIGATPYNYSPVTNPTGGAGLAMAMKTVSNLEDLATGTALAITPYYKAQGGTSGGLLNSSYVPQARINTLANILAACVNTTGPTSGSVDGDGTVPPCNALFTAAKPASGPTPTDTLQAILSIAQHPANNVATLWGISPPDAPFQPSLSSAPADWTLALTYTGGGFGTDPANDPNTDAKSVGMAIDATGNIWILANGACASTAVTNAVYEFDNQGNALSPNSTAANSYCGGYQPTFNGVPVLDSVVGGPVTPAGIAVDLNGNVWVGSQGENGPADPNGGDLTKLSPDGTVQQANYDACPLNGFGGFTCSNVGALAIDGSNNLWVGTADGGLTEVNGTDGSSTSQQTVDGSGNTLPGLSGITLDPFSGSVWTVTTTSDLLQFSEANPPVVTNDFASSGQTFSFRHGVVSDGAGNIFTTSNTVGTINMVPAGQTTVSSFPYVFPASTLGIESLAIDGAGHLWGAAPATVGVTAPNPSYLVEMDNAGNILSPTGTNVYGYTGTGGGGETQTILGNAGGANAIKGIAVDGSGNLWVSNGAVTPAAQTAISPGEQLVEFIGLAAPAVTPTAQALALGELGVRPQAVRTIHIGK